MISLQGMAGFYLAYLEVDIRKILGKFPWMSKIPLQGHGMAAIPKITAPILMSGVYSFVDPSSLWPFSIISFGEFFRSKHFFKSCDLYCIRGLN